MACKKLLEECCIRDYVNIVGTLATSNVLMEQK